VCEDAASFEITVNDLRECIKELDKCIDLAGRPNYRGECQKEDFAKLKGIPPLPPFSYLFLFLIPLSFFPIQDYLIR